MGIIPNVDHRYPENAYLSLLSILTTASQFRGPGKASQPTQDWMPAFQKAVAAVEVLLQCLQLEFQSKAEDLCQDGANVCQLAHAVLAAISVLRKRLHSVATGNSSGAATRESFAIRSGVYTMKHITETGLPSLSVQALSFGDCLQHHVDCTFAFS